jgi:O-antigen ligase/Flp pilus assembly protein TadD
VDLTALTLRWQRWLVLAALVGSSWLFLTGGHDTFEVYKATWVVLVAVATLVVAAVRVSWWRRLVVPRSGALAAVVLLAAGLALSTVASTQPLQSVVGQHSQYAGLATYLAGIVLFFAAVRAFDGATAVLLLRAFVVATLAVGAYALLQKLDLDPIDYQGHRQLASTLANSNFLAGWLSIALGPCLVVAGLRSETTTWRVLGGVAAVLAVGGIQFAGSFQGPVAGGVAALVAGAGLVAFHQPLRRWWTRRNVVLAAAAVVIVGAGAAVVGWSFLDRSLDEGLYDRRAFWSAAWDVVGERPVVGSGPDTFHNQFLTRRPVGHVGQNGGAVHDVPLDLLANGGVVTALPFLALVVLTGWNLVRAVRRAAGERRLVVVGVAAAWAGYVVQALVSIDKPALLTAHFVVAGVAASLVAGEPWTVRLPGALDGRRLLRQGRGWLVPAGVAAAIALAAVVPLTRPVRAELALASGIRKGNQGDITALEDLQDARRLAPWDGVYAYYESLLLRVHGRTGEAVTAAERAAALKPGDVSYAVFTARTCNQLGQATCSVNWWDEAVRRDPYGSSTLYEAGLAAARRGDRATVDRLLPTMRRIDPVVGWSNAGVILARIGDVAEARAAYREALDLEPGYEPAVAGLRKLERAARRR